MTLRLCLLLLAAIPLASCHGQADAGGSSEQREKEPGHALEPSGLVTDFAGLLSKSDIASLTARLELHNESSKHPMVAVTLNSLESEPIDTFTDRLANRWKMGVEDRGIMLIVAPRERQARIAVADGTLPDLPNDVSKSILQEEMLPRFRDGHFYAGLEAGIVAINKHLEGREDQAR